MVPKHPPVRHGLKKYNTHTHTRTHTHSHFNHINHVAHYRMKQIINHRHHQLRHHQRHERLCSLSGNAQPGQNTQRNRGRASLLIGFLASVSGWDGMNGEIRERTGAYCGRRTCQATAPLDNLYDLRGVPPSHHEITMSVLGPVVDLSPTVFVGIEAMRAVCTTSNSTAIAKFCFFTLADVLEAAKCSLVWWRGGETDTSIVVHWCMST